MIQNKIHTLTLNKVLATINLICIFIFFVFTPWVNHAFALPIFVFFILFIVSLFDKNKNKKYKLNKFHFFAFTLILLVFLSQSITKYFVDHYQELSNYEQSFRFMVASIAFLYYQKYPINNNHLVILILVGGVSLVIHNIFNTDHSRLTSVMPSIKHGTYSAIISVLLFYYSFEFIKKEQKINKIFGVLYFFVFIGCMYVTIRTGSKMPVLSLLLIITLISLFNILLYFKKINIKIVLGITLLLLISIISTTYLIKDSYLLKRFDSAITSIDGYEFGSKSTTSTSLRLDMWSIAYLHKFDSFIIGNGQNGIIDLYEKYVSEDKVSSNLANFQHMHSDYIDVYMRNGLLGLLVMIILYLVLIKSGIRYKCMPIILFTLINVLCGMTDITFSHMISITLFLTLLIILFPSEIKVKPHNIEESS